MKVKLKDTVKILSGKDRGKTGKVLRVFRKTNKIVVEKVHVVKKHKKQTNKQTDPGGIIEVESPVSLSKVLVVCPSCGKATRIAYTKKEDKKVRICKKCNEVLDA